MYEPRVEYKYIGKYSPKIDARDKATGRIEYYDDVTLPGKIPRMIFLRFFISPYCNARMAKLDTSKVERYPGVHAVLRYDDPEVEALPWSTNCWTDIAVSPGHRDLDEPRYFDRRCLPDFAKWAGEQMGFCVAADTEDIADEAIKLAEIEWEFEQEPFMEVEEAMKDGCTILHPEINPDSNEMPRWVSYKNYEYTKADYFVRGDVENALKEAEHTVDITATVGGAFSAATLDYRGCTIDWSTGGKITAWTNQFFNENTRIYLNYHLQVPMHKIRVLNGCSGASMGKMNNCDDVYWLAAALISRKAKRPVKYQTDVHEEFHDTRNMASWRVKLGAKKDGTVTAVDMRATGNTGAYYGAAMYVLDNVAPLVAERMMAHVPNMRTGSDVYYTNRMPGGVIRGVANIQIGTALIEALDQLAAELGMDPVELMIKNCGSVYGSLPNESLEAVLRAGAKEIGWERRHKAGEGQYFEGTKKRGMGMSCYNLWHAEWQENLRGRLECSLRVTPDLKVILQAPAIETGNGANTVCVLACAEALDYLNITPDDITWVNHGDTEMSLRDAHPSDSVISVLLSEFMPELAAKLKKEICKRAVIFFDEGCEPGDLDIQDAKVFVKGRPDLFVPAKDVFMEDDCTCQQVYLQRSNNKNVAGVPYGAWFVEVEVDTETGVVEVTRIVIVDDCGQVFQASGAESAQIGGQTMALGETIYEELIYDRKTATVLNTNLIDYKCPLMCDLPPVTPVLKEVWRGAGKYGASGMAEGTLMGTPSAIVNAVYNATGVRMEALPLTPQNVMKALEKAGAANGCCAKGEESR